MAQPVYYKGRIYEGKERREDGAEVIGTHNFKDGQDVTGLYELKHQIKPTISTQWINIDEGAYNLSKALNRRIVAVALPVSHDDKEGYGWTSKKPKFNKECLLIVAVCINQVWEYTAYQIKKIYHEGGWYYGWLTGDGEEYGDLEDLEAGLYLVLQLLPNPSKNNPPR